ncbi:putative ATPase, AAA+ superfamily [Halapricum desulfuricans]|uniref:Putative ATPase, AAA+ superfamily n=1 Tax=Halapricum desulfuricans TaxID=2841257 RepID=A0A897NK12_9EURY|nr:hypothetical protein [Halapricum desulfuricans]QSG11293.1 putative ATPase, AAA+ superfamily [Halapricum desulfuricans]
MSNSNEQEAYAAANLRERLKKVDLSDTSEAYPHAGLVHDDRRLQVLNLLALATDSDIQDSEAYQDLVQPSGTETVNQAVDEGNVSQMQFTVGLVDHSKDGDEAKMRVARTLALEGSIALVNGPPGAGKTALALDAARIWKALTNGIVVSNIHEWDGTDVAVTTSDELLDAMQDHRGQVLGLIDEGSQTLTTKGQDTEGTNKFAKDLKMVRKKQDGDRYAKQGSVMIVGHERSDTGAPIRRLATLVAEKPSRRDPGRMVIYESEGGRDRLDKAAEYQGVTDTPEDYDEHEASQFEVILEDSEDDDGSDQDTTRDMAIATAIRAVKPWTDDAGVSYREAGDIAGYSAGWVSDRVSEWREGQHRDLINDPTA